jgi:hypothetical protein
MLGNLADGADSYSRLALAMNHDTLLILIFILEKEVVILHFSSYQQNNYVLLYNVGSNNFGKCYLKLLSFIS